VFTDAGLSRESLKSLVEAGARIQTVGDKEG
jgi:hypothetical protein